VVSILQMLVRVEAVWWSVPSVRRGVCRRWKRES